jgi:hypothetical protein
MALLEPALAETLAATCLTVIREGMDEVIRRGVPAAAARDFILGHLNIELAIVFGESGWKFSQGCQRAIDEAKPMLFHGDWKKIFECGTHRRRCIVHRSIQTMTEKRLCSCITLVLI